MTAIGSTAITYDDLGNPLTYGTAAYTWQNGRQLASISMNYGAMVYSFEYNDSGIRTSKTVNGVKHIYTLNGSQIVTESWIQSSAGNDVEHVIVYLYDESGAPIGMQYRTSNYAWGEFDNFYFEKNLFGDVVAIYNENGAKIGSYNYDAWGVCTASVEATASTLEKNVVRTLNPFRYRGYYYDTETGFYYLQSRNYNPQWGRFINADKYVSTGQGVLGHNMYAYCNSNPVMYTDETGHIAISVLVALIVIGVLAVTGATIAGINSYQSGNSGLEIAKDIAVGFGVGAAIGGAAVCLSGMGLGLAGVLAVKTAAQVFAIGALGVDFLMFVIMPIETGEQGPGIELSPIDDPTPQPPPSTAPHPGMK